MSRPGLIAILVTVLVAGCGRTLDRGAQTDNPAVPDGSTPEQAAAYIARSLAAEAAGLTLESVEVTDITDVMWSTTALGCPEPGRNYAHFQTAGYRIEVLAGGVRSIYHANQGGFGQPPLVIRCDQPAEAGSLALGAAAQELVRADLAERLGSGVESEAIESQIAPVMELTCNDAAPAPDGPKKVILQFLVGVGGTTHVYRAWGDEILYCGTRGEPVTE